MYNGDNHYRDPWRTASGGALRRERIRATTSPDSFIAAMVKRASGSSLRAKARITEGFSNEVYAVETVDGQHLIVRIHWYQDTPHFEAERWALARCAEVGLPAPRLLLLHHEPVGDELHSVCVETRLAGQTLYRLLTSGTLRPTEARPLLEEAGQLLQRLHAVSTTGYGRIDAEGRGASPKLKFMLTTEMMRGARTIGLSDQESAHAAQFLEQAPLSWQAGDPKLLHGDLSPQQLMVNNRWC